MRRTVGDHLQAWQARNQCCLWGHYRLDFFSPVSGIPILILTLLRHSCEAFLSYWLLAGLWGRWFLTVWRDAARVVLRSLAVGKRLAGEHLCFALIVLALSARSPIVQLACSLRCSEKKILLAAAKPEMLPVISLYGRGNMIRGKFLDFLN